MWPFRRQHHDTASALDHSPGPSPWYLRRPGTGIRSGSATLGWRDAGEKAPFVGKMCLVGPDDASLAVVDFQCYVRQLPSGVVILWHHAWDEGADDKLTNSRIRFVAFDPILLTPIADLKAVCESMAPGHGGAYFQSGILAETWVSAALPAGSHNHVFPDVMKEAAEILVLAAPELDRVALRGQSGRWRDRGVPPGLVQSGKPAELLRLPVGYPGRAGAGNGSHSG